MQFVVAYSWIQFILYLELSCMRGRSVTVDSVLKLLTVQATTKHSAPCTSYPNLFYIYIIYCYKSFPKTIYIYLYIDTHTQVDIK